MLSGRREFQRLGADRLKALEPLVVRLADGAKSCMVEVDQNFINVGFKGQGAVQDDTQASYAG